MVLASTGGASQNGCGQRLQPQEVPVVSCLSRMLQDQQVGLTQASCKLPPLIQDLECVRFCARPIRAESLFFQPSSFPAGRLVSAETLAGEPDVEFGPLPLGEDLYDCNYPPICGFAGPWHVVLTYFISTLFIHLTVVPSICLSLWKLFSISLQVVKPTDSSSVRSYNFSASMGGGEFRSSYSILAISYGLSFYLLPPCRV